MRALIRSAVIKKSRAEMRIALRLLEFFIIVSPPRPATRAERGARRSSGRLRTTKRMLEASRTP